MNKEGIRGIYKGISASFCRESTYSTIRLGLYEPYKNLVGAKEENAPLYLQAVAGLCSGLTGAMFTNPADLLKVRMQTDIGEPKTLRWHAQQVYRQRGLLGFYTGVQPTVIRGGILTAVQLSSYDNVKHRILRYGWL